MTNHQVVFELQNSPRLVWLLNKIQKMKIYEKKGSLLVYRCRFCFQFCFSSLILWNLCVLMSFHELRKPCVFLMIFLTNARGWFPLMEITALAALKCFPVKCFRCFLRKELTDCLVPKIFLPMGWFPKTSSSNSSNIWSDGLSS